MQGRKEVECALPKSPCKAAAPCQQRRARCRPSCPPQCSAAPHVSSLPLPLRPAQKGSGRVWPECPLKATPTPIRSGQRLTSSVSILRRHAFLPLRLALEGAMTSADRCLAALLCKYNRLSLCGECPFSKTKLLCFARLASRKALEQHCLQVAKLPRSTLGASELVSPPGLTNLSQSTLKFHAIQAHDDDRGSLLLARAPQVSSEPHYYRPGSFLIYFVSICSSGHRERLQLQA